MLAIIKVADALVKSHPGPVNQPVDIYVDSLSAFQSLESVLLVTQLIRECFNSLTELSLSRPVSLHWIPAHSEYSGNERVDELAKLAAQVPFVGPPPSIPIALQLIDTALTGWVKIHHSSR